MNEVISREIKWGDQVLSIETGKVAKQATASTIVNVWVHTGDIGEFD